jgi:predicted amidohydrolase
MVNASVIQMKMGENREANIDKAEAMVRKAASDGGQIVLSGKKRFFHHQE